MGHRDQLSILVELIVSFDKVKHLKPVHAELLFGVHFLEDSLLLVERKVRELICQKYEGCAHVKLLCVGLVILHEDPLYVCRNLHIILYL